MCFPDLVRASQDLHDQFIPLGRRISALAYNCTSPGVLLPVEIDAYGGTPLVAAALNGALDCVRVLTAAGADVNHTTNNLNTPLMKAAINGCAAASSLALPLSSAWMPIAP